MGRPVEGERGGGEGGGASVFISMSSLYEQQKRVDGNVWRGK